MEPEFEENQEVANPARPEWGVGRVLSVEPGSGGRGARVRVNFAGAGVKTLVVPPGRLVPPQAQAEPEPAAHESLGYSGSSEARLRTIPAIITDRRAAWDVRITELVKLYQFDDSPRDIFNWAALRTGQADPLNEFSADELAAYFRDFCRRRDRVLKDLCHEAKRANAAGQFRSLVDAKTTERVREKLYLVLGW